MKVLNAFSLNMLQGSAQVSFDKVSKEAAIEQLQGCSVESAVGHAETANVLSEELGIEIPANRVSVALESGETAVVAQYKGPRLPEGATQLPEGAKIEYYIVRIT